MNDREISGGSDILGALLMGHPYNSWWTGSILPIDEAKKLAPGQNATTIQVALGVVSAVMWMIENPKKGFCLPDDLPHEFVLDIAKPYLGEFWSGPSDWTPLKNRNGLFPGRTLRTTTTSPMSGNSKTSYLCDESLMYQQSAEERT